MITNRKTPGVYITEGNAFPNAVAQVETAIPAFIGYTPRAEYEGKSYLFKPIRITSMADFVAIYGYPIDPTSKKAPVQYSPSYFITKVAKKPLKGAAYVLNDNIYSIEPDPNTIYYLYNSLLLFFQNGGSQAYIVSVGSYGAPSGVPIAPGEQIVNPNVLLVDLENGLTALKTVPEVTIYIFPEATLLSSYETGTLMKLTLDQCGTMRTAMAIFDVKGGREPDPVLWKNDIQNFRNSTGNKSLKFGAAYYPFLKTSAVEINKVTYANINGGDVSVLKPILSPSSKPNQAVENILSDILGENSLAIEQNSAALAAVSKEYKNILSVIREKINTLPTSGVMAGVYSMVDSTAGVWKAPANISLTGVTDLTLRINNAEQENLNIDPVSGKSVNVIRLFNGQGVMVWGARTLDGNSGDWRYINARRLVTMIEQSTKLALRNFVFSPNDQSAWIIVQSVLINFLTLVWKEGGLQGATASDAFDVKIGLGTTMTQQDILDGFLKVSLSLAVNYPAEFVVVNIEQVMAQ